MFELMIIQIKNENSHPHFRNHLLGYLPRRTCCHCHPRSRPHSHSRSRPNRRNYHHRHSCWNNCHCRCCYSCCFHYRHCDQFRQRCQRYSCRAIHRCYLVCHRPRGNHDLSYPYKSFIQIQSLTIIIIQNSSNSKHRCSLCIDHQTFKSKFVFVEAIWKATLIIKSNPVGWRDRINGLFNYNFKFCRCVIYVIKNKQNYFPITSYPRLFLCCLQFFQTNYLSFDRQQSPLRFVQFSKGRTRSYFKYSFGCKYPLDAVCKSGSYIRHTTSIIGKFCSCFIFQSSESLSSLT